MAGAEGHKGGPQPASSTRPFGPSPEGEGGLEALCPVAGKTRVPGTLARLAGQSPHAGQGPHHIGPVRKSLPALASPSSRGRHAAVPGPALVSVSPGAALPRPAESEGPRSRPLGEATKHATTSLSRGALSALEAHGAAIFQAELGPGQQHFPAASPYAPAA